MKAAGIRALYTFLHAFFGVLAVVLIPWLTDLVVQLTDEAGGHVEIDTTFLSNVVLAALISGVIALITFGHALLEELEPRTRIIKE